MALYKDAEGKPTQKIYKRIGIRRDRNFSDLSSQTEGLENLLDSLVVDTGDSFLATDLNAIQNLFARGMSNSNYLNIAGSSVKFTTPGVTDPPLTVSYDPRITYQNRLDKIEVFTGTPRFSGGNGLTAKYFQNDQINFDEHDDLAGIGTGFNYNVDPNTTNADVFSGITTEGIIPDDNFWEEGDFEYDGNVHPQSSKVNTGVKWEGYYISRITGTTRFDISSTGYFTMDFQQVGYKEDNDKNIISSGIGTYTEHVRIGVSTSISGISSTSETQITVSGAANLEKMNTIGVGMTVVHPKIVPGTKISREDGFNKVTGTIELEPPSGNSSAFTAPIGSNQSMTFTRSLGDMIRHTFDTQVLTAYEKYRIRIRYFHNKNFELKNVTKRLDLDFQEKYMSTTDDLRFNQLFTLDYDFSNSAKGNFNRYEDNSVRFGGTNLVGIGNSTNKLEYVKVKSNNKVDVTYKVKRELGSDGGSKINGIIRRKMNCTTENGSTVIITGLTSHLEIGNYVFGTGIPTDARIIEIVINQFIIIDKVATVSAVNNLTFINHRGFVKKVNGSHNANNITSITPGLRADPPSEKTVNTDVQVGMVAIGEKLSQYTIINEVTINSMVLSKTVTSTGSADVYIYQSRGLKDNTLKKFCGKFDTTPSVQCLIATAPVDTKTPPLGDSFLPNEVPVETTTAPDGTVSAGAINTGNATNWNIQGFNFASGTKIQSISTNKITLTQNIDKAIVSGTQFTATLNTDDRQLCCPPTDTSPPFTATEEGLNTTLSERPNLRFENGNLVFSQLLIQNNGSNITNASSSSPVNRKINIKTPSSTQPFKILATT